MGAGQITELAAGEGNHQETVQAGQPSGLSLSFLASSGGSFLKIDAAVSAICSEVASQLIDHFLLEASQQDCLE